MKKRMILIAVMIACIISLFSINNYAATLDSISIDVNKTTVKPGEQVKLTISFGDNLTAYTFHINYDKNIFEYVSADGGVANDVGGKVNVVFYDESGGSNPRENMSIIFKAKDDIETSNPTEFTVTGEGFGKADTTINLDDITTPMVKNITVKPEYENYDIKLQYTGEIIKGEEKDVKISFSSNMGQFYEHARLIAEATTPEGATVKITGINKDENVVQDIIKSGWGDPQGYEIGGKNFEQVLNMKALFSDEGDYKVTIKLIDRDNSDSIISEKQFSFKVLKEATNLEVTNKNTAESVGAINNVANNNTTTLPTSLPKTGYNTYVPMIIALVIIISFSMYFKYKREK